MLIIIQTQSSEWKDSGIPIHGVNWARSEKTVTKGIHFWEPIVFKKHDGNEVSEEKEYATLLSLIPVLLFQMMI